jgi:antagonist of KipI
VLEVVDPGPLLLVQDRGRPGLGRLGVPPSGALDGWAMTAANLLAGAPPDAPVVEVTLGGTMLRVVEPCAVAITGANLGAELDDGRPLEVGTTHLLAPGSTLGFAGGSWGLRAVLGFAGGVRARRVLGSASTWAPGASDGVVGAGLAAGDRIAPARRGDLRARGRVWPTSVAPHPAHRGDPVAVVPGPDLRHLSPDTVEAFVTTAWRAAAEVDRMGIRLEGDPLPAGREILSHPLVPGAIQVPGDGRPLVLLADGPTIGGYPVLGVVARADLPRLGQARPGDELRFAPVTADAARAAWREQQRALAAAASAMGADDLWTSLVDSAGA